MVHKELVEYIKTHHGRGHSFKQLHDHLIHHGHSSHDVNEAINAARHSAHHPAHHGKRKPGARKMTGLALIVSVALVIFILALVLTWPEKNPINCGTDFACFIEAAAGCNPAKVTLTTSANIFGMITSATSRVEIRGTDAGKCLLYDKQEDASVSFSDELIQSMLDNGQAIEDIRQNEQTASESAQMAAGVEKICKFYPDDLTAMLHRWDQGTFSGGVSCAITDGELTDCTFSGDFANAECAII